MNSHPNDHWSIWSPHLISNHNTLTPVITPESSYITQSPTPIDHRIIHLYLSNHHQSHRLIEITDRTWSRNVSVSLIRVINMIGWAEEWGAIQWEATTWFWKTDDENNFNYHLMALATIDLRYLSPLYPFLFFSSASPMSNIVLYLPLGNSLSFKKSPFEHHVNIIL